MPGQTRRYLSYLLRLWQARDDGGMVWRVLLESPDGQERRWFANLGALNAYLARITEGAIEALPGSSNESAEGEDSLRSG